LNGFGPTFFGHGVPFIKDAVREVLDAGYHVGPQIPLAGEAAALLCELTGMDRATWVNTGSEAVQAALRVARTVRGRDKVAVFAGSYHGNFDEVLIRPVGQDQGQGRRAMPLAPGIPESAASQMVVLDYGSDAALEAIEAQAGELAAVLVEPVQSRRPGFRPHAFVKKLRTLTEEKNIVLIFDEVITGFRTGLGGAQALYGIKADLATYGKVLGGGMPIGAVAGKKHLMDTFDGGWWTYGDASRPSAPVTFFAGTFVRHPLAIAAAHASLSYLKSVGPALQEGVTERTARLVAAVNGVFEARGVLYCLSHCTSQMWLDCAEDSPLASLLYLHLRERGVHILEGFPCYLTAAHTDDDVDAIVSAFEGSLDAMLADGVLPARKPLVQAARPFALTGIQTEIWAACQRGAGATEAFLESDTLIIDGPLDRERLSRAVLETAKAHEALRLRFAEDGLTQQADAPMGDVYTERTVELGSDPMAALDLILLEEAVRPLDLASGPLARFLLVSLTPGKASLTFFWHHLVCDGYSAGRVLSDIAARYRGETAEPATAFSAFVAQTRDPKADRAARDALAHWHKVFADGVPAPLDLPTREPYRDRPTTAGATVRRTLPAPLASALRQTARSLSVSLHALMLSSYTVLLGRLSGQEDFVIGIPAAGQIRTGIDAVGCCVGMTPLRVQPHFDQPFADYAKANHRASLAGTAHVPLPLSEIARSISVQRDDKRLPLVDVVFDANRYLDAVDFGDCTAVARENPRRAVHYDLFFNLGDFGDRLEVTWDYRSDRFAPDELDAWLDHWMLILEACVADPSAALGLLGAEMGSAAQDRGDDEGRAGVSARAPGQEPHPVPAAHQDQSGLSETQAAVATAFCRVLGQAAVPPDVSFFDLGGHSLLAMRAVAQLRREAAPTLTLRDFFDADTVIALAALIDGGVAPKPEPVGDDTEYEELEF
ncbi:MAG: aminotransferase class III-fold pyridoxal phosphate-dependent enzyme, partial [Pseudomonadota bacterium]